MTTQPSPTCQNGDCTAEPRMAAKTTRQGLRGLRTTVYYDDRDAPSTALRYCKRHGVALVADLARTVVADDDL